jgi:hypothetical protein
MRFTSPADAARLVLIGRFEASPRLAGRRDYRNKDSIKRGLVGVTCGRSHPTSSAIGERSHEYTCLANLLSGGARVDRRRFIFVHFPRSAGMAFGQRPRRRSPDQHPFGRRPRSDFHVVAY